MLNTKTQKAMWCFHSIQKVLKPGDPEDVKTNHGSSWNKWWGLMVRNGYLLVQCKK